MHDVYQLHDRALHVFTENARVESFRDVCERADGGSISSKEALGQLGAILNKGHASCRDLYQVSCPELEALVKACRWVSYVDIV